MDYRCRHRHDDDAEGKEPGNELRMVINVLLPGSAWYSVALYRKEKHFRS